MMQGGKSQIGELNNISAVGNRTDPGQAGNSLMGEGAPNVIEDEAALIPNPVHAKVMRMLGGHKKNFLYKIGNPFNRNHFLDSSRDSKYHRIHIDWRQAVKEGRYTQEYIDEMREQDFFDILYEVKFPPAGSIDAKGWIPMITEEEFENCLKKVQSRGAVKLGVDVAEGGCANAYVERSDNYMWLRDKDFIDELYRTQRKIVHYMKEDGITENNTSVDATGSGSGVASNLRGLGCFVNAVKNGATDVLIHPEKYTNVKSQNYWRFRRWIRQGGCINPKDRNEFKNLMDLRYRIVDNNGKVQFMPKKIMFAYGLKSPDVPEAAALTFHNPDPPNSADIQKQEQDMQQMMESNPAERNPETGELE